MVNDKTDGRTVLVVDDHDDIRQLMRMSLQMNGCSVVEAVNGKEAVELASQVSPGLILMDLSMPVLDGYEATRQIKANPELRHIPIVAVTSSALSGDDLKARAAGCDAYITKPFSPRALLAKIREYVP